MGVWRWRIVARIPFTDWSLVFPGYGSYEVHGVQDWTGKYNHFSPRSCNLIWAVFVSKG